MLKFNEIDHSVWGPRDKFSFPGQTEVEEARALYSLLRSRLDEDSGEVTIGIASPENLNDGEIEHIELIDAGGDAPEGVRNIRINRSMMARIAWLVSVVADGRQTHSFSVFDYMSINHAATYLHESEEAVMDLISSGRIESADRNGATVVRSESIWEYMAGLKKDGNLKDDIMQSSVPEDAEYRDAMRLKAA